MYRLSILFSALLFLYFPSAHALVINAVGVAAGEDFNDFNGSGFSPSPTAGQLDSDVWRVTGLSDGDGSFGGSYEVGDFARGVAYGAVSRGGIWSFDTASGSGTALGVQPTGSDFTPGAITLKVMNNTPTILTSLLVEYDLFVFNDQRRSSFFNFSYSGDDLLYADVATALVVSPEAADNQPSWVRSSRSFTLTGLSILGADPFYLRWSGGDNSTPGRRDQFALDNIRVTAFSAAPVSVPGPSSWFLIALGLVVLGYQQRVSVLR